MKSTLPFSILFALDDKSTLPFSTLFALDDKRTKFLKRLFCLLVLLLDVFFSTWILSHWIDQTLLSIVGFFSLVNGELLSRQTEQIVEINSELATCILN